MEEQIFRGVVNSVNQGTECLNVQVWLDRPGSETGTPVDHIQIWLPVPERETQDYWVGRKIEVVLRVGTS